MEVIMVSSRSFGCECREGPHYVACLLAGVCVDRHILCFRMQQQTRELRCVDPPIPIASSAPGLCLGFLSALVVLLLEKECELLYSRAC